MNKDSMAPPRNDRLKKNHRGSSGSNHPSLSSSMTQRVLCNKELRNILADEIKSTGVVTASGYQAVLQKFLLSESVAKQMGEESNNSEDSDAEKWLKEMFAHKKCEETFSRTNSRVYPQGYHGLLKRSPSHDDTHSVVVVDSSSCESTPTSAKMSPPTGLKASLTRLFSASLEDELVERKDKYSSEKDNSNLAPRNWKNHQTKQEIKMRDLVSESTWLVH